MISPRMSQIFTQIEYIQNNNLRGSGSKNNLEPAHHFSLASRSVRECQVLLGNYNLSNAENKSKIQWMNEVKNSVTEANRRSLLSLIKEKYKKLDYNTLSDENCEITKPTRCKTKICIKNKN